MSKFICPVCGGGTDSKNPVYHLADADICRRCADQLRFHYPLFEVSHSGGAEINLGDVERCCGLDREQLARVRANTVSGYYVHTVDMMGLLSLSEFTAQLSRADALEDKIRQQYWDFSNICTVEEAEPVGREDMKGVGIQHMKLWQGSVCMTGWIKAGRFRPGDMVSVLHEGRRYTADILKIQHRWLNTEKVSSICAGYHVRIFLNSKARMLSPGDLIVSD